MNCRRLIPLLVAAALALVPVAQVPAVAQQADDETIKLPLTFNKVWFRNEKKKGLGKLKAFKHSGLLTLTEDGLDFVGEKNSYFFPIEDIEMLSLGKLGKDVNTDWAVLSVREEGGLRKIGLRDGRKWGYGDETLEIYTQIRLALRQLDAGLYAHPEGYRAYDRLRHQVVLVYPAEWSAYVVRSVFVSEGAAYGRVVFSPRPAEALAEQMKEHRGLPDVDLGRELAVIFDRSDAESGMRCSGWKSKARQSLLEYVGRYPVLAEAEAILDPPSLEDATIAGCAALRVTARTQDPEVGEAIVDARIFANDGTLFVLGTRVPVGHAEEAREILDVMAGSVLLPVAYDGEF